MRKLLKEPLLHFAALALAIFALYAAIAPKDGVRSAEDIVVSSAKVEQMAAVFAKTWNRPPSPEEMQALVDDYIVEEVLVREALALGLDEDDTLIRRRLRQKIEFLSEEALAPLAPDDASLQAFLEANADRYAINPQISFTQVYLSPTRHGPALKSHALALLGDLVATPDTDTRDLGDPTLLPRDVPLSEVTRIGNEFGIEFASALAELPTGQWSGPVESTYGLHVVRITARQPGRTPPLAEVRDDVLRDWTTDARTTRAKERLATLIAGYNIIVEKPREPTS